MATTTTTTTTTDEERTFARTYTAPSFARTLSSSPRFGHTRDITSLVSDWNNGLLVSSSSSNTTTTTTVASGSDYVAGVVSAAAITAVCFVLVALAVLVLKCIGRARVGFLSGHAFRQGYGVDDYDTNHHRRSSNNMSSPHHDNQSMDEDDVYTVGGDDSHVKNDTKKNASDTAGARCRACCHRVTVGWVRGTFIASGTLFILCAVLLVTQGLVSLQDTVHTAHASAADVEVLSAEAETILGVSLRDLQPQAVSARTTLVQELGSTATAFCPADPTLQDNAVARDVQQQADEAIALLEQLDDFLSGSDVDTMATAVEQVHNGAALVREETGQIDVTDWHALLLLIPFTLVPCLLVAAAILAQFDVRLPPVATGVLQWVLLPLLVVMVLVSAAVASAMIAAGSINADVCLPGPVAYDSYAGRSPDTTVYRVLDRQGYARSSDTTTDVVRQVVDYYVGQCDLNDPAVTDPFLPLTVAIPDLVTSSAALDDLAANVLTNATLQELGAYCQRDFATIPALVVDMQTILTTLLDALERTLDVVSCERIVPLYHQAVYEGACDFAVQAGGWIFSCALLMGALGLVMLLLRAATVPTDYDDDVMDEHARRMAHQAPVREAPVSSSYRTTNNNNTHDAPGHRHGKPQLY